MPNQNNNRKLPHKCVQCPMCLKIFKDNNQNLYQHSRYNHDNRQLEWLEVEYLQRRERCNECGKTIRMDKKLRWKHRTNCKNKRDGIRVELTEVEPLSDMDDDAVLQQQAVRRYMDGYYKTTRNKAYRETFEANKEKHQVKAAGVSEEQLEAAANKLIDQIFFMNLNDPGPFSEEICRDLEKLKAEQASITQLEAQQASIIQSLQRQPIQTNDQITEQPNSSLLDKEINPLFDGIQASLKHQDQVSEPSPLQTLPVVKTEKIFEKRLPVVKPQIDAEMEGDKEDAFTQDKNEDDQLKEEKPRADEQNKLMQLEEDRKAHELKAKAQKDDILAKMIQETWSTKKQNNSAIQQILSLPKMENDAKIDEPMQATKDIEVPLNTNTSDKNQSEAKKEEKPMTDEQIDSSSKPASDIKVDEKKEEANEAEPEKKQKWKNCWMCYKPSDISTCLECKQAVYRIAQLKVPLLAVRRAFDSILYWTKAATMETIELSNCASQKPLEQLVNLLAQFQLDCRSAIKDRGRLLTCLSCFSEHPEFGFASDSNQEDKIRHSIRYCDAFQTEKLPQQQSCTSCQKETIAYKRHYEFDRFVVVKNDKTQLAKTVVDWNSKQYELVVYIGHEQKWNEGILDQKAGYQACCRYQTYYIRCGSDGTVIQISSDVFEMFARRACVLVYKRNDSVQVLAKRLPVVDYAKIEVSSQETGRYNIHAQKKKKGPYKANQYEYQLAAVKVLTMKFHEQTGFCLADEMGLGKTRTAITYVQSQEHNLKKVLVVCPKSALLVWKKELTDFKDLQQNNHAILVVDGQSSQKTDVIRNSNSNYKFFLVIGVEQFASYILDNSKQGKALMQTGFDLLIIDEAHALRKKTLQASKAVSEMKRADPTLKLLLLTGTPMQNNFTELFELINIMRPTAELETTAAPFGMYPNMAKEKKEFLKIAREAGPAMKSKIEEYFLRRYKYQVLDLPDKCDMTVWLTLTPAIRSIHERVEVLYSQKLKEVNASINESNLKTHQNASDDAEHLDGDEELEDTDTRSNPVLAIYGSLISLVNDVSCMKQRVQDSKLRFITKIKDYLDKLQLAGTGSSKTKFIMNLLAKVQMKNERVLIFSRQKRYLDHLEPLINKEFNISCEYIHGDVEAPERQSIAERINKSKAFGVCLLTTQAGNQALTLHGANHLILVDSSWNPSNDAQAVDRVHRIGQEKRVYIYRLVSLRSIEERVLHVQYMKNRNNQETFVNKYSSMTKLNNLFGVELSHQGPPLYNEFLQGQPSVTKESLTAEYMGYAPELDEWLGYMKGWEEVEMVTNHSLVAGSSVDYFDKVLK